ncbi:hypothetical protein KGY64_02255 [Candidatus Bipolaricaulota bacterium]|nr:hypothetical protein [Candidatus Bipolaricaulota bacterium]
MNISRFKNLTESRQERIGEDVSHKVLTEWSEQRPTDLRELSSTIDLENITIDTKEDIFGIKQSLPPSSSIHLAEIFREFCDDIITEIVTSI